LPVAQTKDDNVTDYIVSNLIGITDGHLLFDEVEFSKGRTPALNFQLSVTRVGRQVQTRLAQEIARKTLSFMTSKYLSSLSISHFGSELNEDILEVLHKGDLIFAFLTQEEIEEVPEICQRVFFGALMADFFKLESPIKMPFYRKNLVNNFNNNKKATELVNSLAGAPTFNDLVKKLDLYKAEFLSICKSFGK